MIGFDILKTVILFILLTLNPIYLLFSQTKVFIGKPDKNIRMVVGLSDNGGEFHDTIRVLEYNRQGLLIHERIPASYIFLDYWYDDSNRLVQKEALYGESFANGATSYIYSGDTIIEISSLLASGQKTVKLHDKQARPIKEISWYVSTNGSESFIEEITYDYSATNQLQLQTIKRNYYHINVEGESSFWEYVTSIQDLFIPSEILRSEEIGLQYNYKKERLVSVVESVQGTNHKRPVTSYKYNCKGLIVQKKEIAYIRNNFGDRPLRDKIINHIIYKYDKQGDIIEILESGMGYSLKCNYLDGRLNTETEIYKGTVNEKSVINYRYLYFDESKEP